MSIPSTPLSDLAVESLGESLLGVRIALCVGGGIAAMEAPRLARALRRLGATVQAFATANALRFIGEESLEWATEEPVVVNPTGRAQHIFSGDLVVVAPATADLLGKAAGGLCTDGVTTLLQSAFGRQCPVLFVPTMHDTMASSPIVESNCRQLGALPGVFFLPPREEEGKKKIPEPQALAETISHVFWKHQWKVRGVEDSLKAAVSLGGTRVALDPVRSLGNLSSGAFGQALVEAMYLRGFAVTVLEGVTRVPTPERWGQKLLRVPDFSQMERALDGLNPENTTLFFSIAAASDFLPLDTQKEKISSAQEHLVLEFKKAPKLLAKSNIQSLPWRMACKLTTGDKDIGLAAARTYMNAYTLGMVLWNSLEALGSESHHPGVLIVRKADGSQQEIPVQDKKQIAALCVSAYLEGVSLPRQFRHSDGRQKT